MTSSRPALQRITASSRGAKMGTWLVGMGILHFVVPQAFDGIVPEELPGTKRFYTLASGVAEAATGGLLLAPRTRRVGALAAIALFVAVFPGNVNMVRLWRNKPLPMQAIAVARLPLQIPMITQAMKVYRES